MNETNETVEAHEVDWIEQWRRQRERAEVAEAGLAQARELLSLWLAFDSDDVEWDVEELPPHHATRRFLASYPVSKKEET